MERAVVMGNGKEILPEDLPISASRTQLPGLQVGLTLEEALNRFKREFIVLNLNHTGGNRSQAAKVMDIQRTYLSRLISKFDITGNLIPKTYVLTFRVRCSAENRHLTR